MTEAPAGEEQDKPYTAEERARDEELLPGYYRKFRKFFRRMDEPDQAAREAGLNAAATYIRKINELEERLYPPQKRANLSFYNIFEKARQAGTPELVEVLEINAALKASEQVALARLDRLETLYREMRKKGYAEIMKGKTARGSEDALRGYLRQMTDTAEAIEKIYAPLAESLIAFGDKKEQDGGDGGAGADPLLVLLHKALREDIDFVRLLEEGKKGKLPLKERLARKLMNVPLDEKDVAVWRRMHAALTTVVDDQRTALASLEQIPALLNDMKENLLVIQAEREAESVPRGTHDDLVQKFTDAQEEFMQARDEKGALEQKITALDKEKGDLQTKYNEMMDRSTARVEKLRRWEKQRHRIAGQIRTLRNDLCDARTLVAALQTGRLENIVATLKEQAVVNDEERKKFEADLAGKDKDLKNKNAELQVLQERIDLWVSDAKKQQEEIRFWQVRAAKKWGLTATFAVAAGVAGYAAGHVPWVSESSANLSWGLVLWPTGIFSAAGAILGALIGSENGKGKKYAAIGGFLVGGAAFAATTISTSFAQSSMDTNVRQYCLQNKCESGPNVDVYKDDNGNWVVKLPPPAPK